MIDIDKIPSPRLFVVGDSFSAVPRNGNAELIWITSVAKNLSNQIGREVTVINSSLHGSSQVWCWWILQRWLHQYITKDDYLIVVLTHPNRYWFIEDKPEISNPAMVDFDQHLSKEAAKAVAGYVMHIQRPILDTIHLIDRLGLLAYYVSSKGLRKPLMIKAFEQYTFEADNFKELNWARGSLTENVQRNEFAGDIVSSSSYWQGIDARYNHLCLSNHAILANKATDALLTGTQLDLTSGFLKGLIGMNAINDEEFCKKELDMSEVERGRKNRDWTKPMTAWKDRIRTGVGS